MSIPTTGSTRPTANGLYEAARETGADVACASMLKIRPSYSKWTIRYTERQVVADAGEVPCCRCPPDFYVMNKLLRREMLLAAGAALPRKGLLRGCRIHDARAVRGR